MTASRGLTLLVVSLLTGFLLAGAGSAHAAKLTVTPKTAQLGKKTCFTFTATRQGKRLAKHRIQFVGGRLYTGPKGRAYRCVRLRWAGRHGAWLPIENGRSDWAMIRVKPRKGVSTVGGSWHQFVVNLPAWGAGSQGCEQAIWGEKWDTGCWAKVTGVGTTPFPTGRTAGFIFGPDPKKGMGINMRNWYYDDFYGMKRQYFNDIWGWSPGPGSGAYYVDASNLREIKVEGAYTGTDPAKEGLQGGPLHIEVIRHDPFFERGGYNFYVAGYLFY